MKHYLSTLNDREKYLVVLASVCLIIYAYYTFLYSPMAYKVTQKKAQLQEKTETLSWMQQFKEQGHTLKKSKETLSNSQLLTLLANQLKENTTLKFAYQLQQTSTGDIQLTFDAVPFQLFMTWLAQINDRYNIIIKQFNVQSSTTAGITKLMIVISAKS